MPNLLILEVVSGLLLVYLVYSFIVSIVVELFVEFTGIRARILRKCIERLLNDIFIVKFHKGAGFFFNFKVLVKKVWLVYSDYLLIENSNFKNSFASAFYSNPMIFYLGENNQNSKPSAITPDKFATVVISLLSENKSTNAEFSILESLNQGNIQINRIIYKLDNEKCEMFLNTFKSVDYDIMRFKNIIKGWYVDTTLAGNQWFRKKVQKLLFFFGFLFAMVFNLNTFKVIAILSSSGSSANQSIALLNDLNKNMIQQVQVQKSSVSKSESTAESLNDDVPDSILKESLYISQQIYSLIDRKAKYDSKILGMGWGLDTVSVFTNVSDPMWKKTVKNFYFKFKFIIANTFNPLSNFFGFLLSALAISLGGTFWLNVLKRFGPLKGFINSIDADLSRPPDTTIK